jgi:hypothetical protein
MGALRGKIRYATLTAEINSAGLDARREDGSSHIVLWDEVVGVIARRLPDELEGSTFVDIVSTAGSTLRILPWTKLGGDALEGGGDVRARALVIMVASRCTTAKIDAATRAFVEDDQPPAQLDGEHLAALDERLA